MELKNDFWPLLESQGQVALICVCEGRERERDNTEKEYELCNNGSGSPSMKNCYMGLQEQQKSTLFLVPASVVIIAMKLEACVLP